MACLSRKEVTRKRKFQGKPSTHPAKTGQGHQVDLPVKISTLGVHTAELGTGGEGMAGG
jgi:hypothetical protein